MAGKKSESTLFDCCSFVSSLFSLRRCFLCFILYLVSLLFFSQCSILLLVLTLLYVLRYVLDACHISTGPAIKIAGKWNCCLSKKRISFFHSLNVCVCIIGQVKWKQVTENHTKISSMSTCAYMARFCCEWPKCASENRTENNEKYLTTFVHLCKRMGEIVLNKQSWFCCMSFFLHHWKALVLKTLDTV